MPDPNLDLGLQYTGGIRAPVPGQESQIAIVDEDGTNLKYVRPAGAAHDWEILQNGKMVADATRKLALIAEGVPTEFLRVDFASQVLRPGTDPVAFGGTGRTATMTCNFRLTNQVPSGDDNSVQGWFSVSRTAAGDAVLGQINQSPNPVINFDFADVTFSGTAGLALFTFTPSDDSYDGYWVLEFAWTLVDGPNP